MSAHSFEDVHTFLLRDVRLVNGPSRPHCPHTDHLSCSPAVLSRIKMAHFIWALPMPIPSCPFLMFFIVKESLAAKEFKVVLPAFLERRHICLDWQSGCSTLLEILVPIFNHWPQFSRTSLGDTEACHLPRWPICIGMSWWLFRWRRRQDHRPLALRRRSWTLEAFPFRFQLLSFGLLFLPLFDSLLPVFDSSLPILDCPFPFLFPLCAHFLYESFLAIFKAGHSCLDG
mmetsp:Transcript_153631/g.286374  ORF Transcript_153631/g.286374 Transcript_153631/m.286374 type:complete len:229 (+) Transcript_153631:779-1465(+)